MISVLYSGGVESVVLANMAVATGEPVSLHLVNYGQAPYLKQLAIGRQFESQHENVSLHTVLLPYIQWVDQATAAHPGFNPGQVGMAFSREDDNAIYKQGIPYIHGRNPMMIMAAAIQASYLGSQRLWVGWQMNDDELPESTEPHAERGHDETEHTVQLCNEMIRISFPRPFLVNSPLLNMNKRMVMGMAHSFGIDLRESYSCEFVPACGQCSQCRDRQKATASAG